MKPHKPQLPPDDAPASLLNAYQKALSWWHHYQQLSIQIASAARQAKQASDQYDIACLEYRGQMKLFETETENS